jgi:hypothetical protein
LVYLLFNLFGPGEGDFDKDHETVAALITLFAWALCMKYFAPSRLCRIMAAASAIAASIITQAIGVLLVFFTGMLGAIEILRQRWRDMWGYALVAASIALSTIVVFLVSYQMTGMASDQPFAPMLRFANLSKLDQWGVLPQLVAVAWIRHNYQIATTPFGLKAAYEDLVDFMRLRALWPFLAAPLITAAAMGISSALAKSQFKPSHNPIAASFAAFASRRIGGLVLFLAAISPAVGHVQRVSFERLSSFFVPLLVLLAVAGSIRVIEATSWRHRDHAADSSSDRFLYRLETAGSFQKTDPRHSAHSTIRCRIFEPRPSVHVQLHYKPSLWRHPPGNACSGTAASS